MKKIIIWIIIEEMKLIILKMKKIMLIYMNLRKSFIFVIYFEFIRQGIKWMEIIIYWKFLT